MKTNKHSSGRKSRFTIYWFARCLGIIGLSLLAARLFIYLGAKYYHDSPKQENTRTCQLQTESCQRALPDKRSVKISINPQPFYPGQSVEAQVETFGFYPSAIRIFIYPLKTGQVPTRGVMMTSQKVGNFAVQVPLDSSDSAQWVALVAMQTDKETIAIPFKFIMHKK